MNKETITILFLMTCSFICLDNLLDQFVPNYIGTGKIDKLYAIYIAKKTLSLNQAGRLSPGQVALGYISGDYCLGIEP